MPWVQAQVPVEGRELEEEEEEEESYSEDSVQHPAWPSVLTFALHFCGC